MNKLLALCFSGVILATSFKTKAQNCTGDACSVVLETATPPNALKYTNTSPDRSVRIGRRPAILFGPPGNMTYNNLGPRSSINLGGAYVGAYEATFITAATGPIVNYATPKFDNATYRIKNVVTGGYIYDYIDPATHQHKIKCDNTISPFVNVAKWLISCQQLSVFNSNREEGYRMDNKESNLYLYGDYPPAEGQTQLHADGNFTTDFVSMKYWELVRGNGNHVFIKLRNKEYYVNIQNGNLVLSEIADFTDQNQWIIEKAL